MIEDKKIKKSKHRVNSGNTEQDRLERIEYLEDLAQTQLPHLKTTAYSCKEVDGNIESYLGSIEVPVGLCGPIKMLHKDGSTEDIYAPVATSEGALIASMTRGAYAISLAGGFNSKVIRQRMSRCPMFCFQTMNDADRFCDWVQLHFNDIKNETKKYSNHANLVSLDPQLFGRNVHLKFDFETGDASGQNMTTTCTWNACLWIEKKYNDSVLENQKILSHAIEANGSSDKKVSSRSTITTRGIRVISECHFPEKILKRILKSSSQDILDLYVKANPVAVNDGMNGYNVNVANAIAAFFASTGQDLACIHESAVGILQVEKTDTGLYMAMTLPSLVIGTIGGGTGLKGPKEILKVLGCQGKGKVERLAQIIAGYALGLELSTMSAVMSGQFATSHERLGRNRPVETLKEHELNLNFFQNQLNMKDLDNVRTIYDMEIKNGIVSEVTSKVSNKPIGFYPFILSSQGQDFNTVLKIKPLDEEILLGFEIIAGLVSMDLKESYAKWKKKNAFINSHIKEIEAYKALNQSHPHLIPKYFGSTKIPEREIYAVAKEYLNEKEITHYNSEDSPELWSKKDKESVITAISAIHGDYYGQAMSFTGSSLSLPEKQTLIDFYTDITTQAYEALEWFDQSQHDWFLKIVNDIPNWYQEYIKLPQTFIHNDFNTRNICMRSDGTPCFYDWELCETSPPQRDFIEFMAFTQTDTFDAHEFEELSKKHFDTFVSNAEIEIKFEDWQKGLLLSAYEFLVDRLSFYMIGNIINQYKFLNRVYFSTKELIEYMEKQYCKL